MSPARILATVLAAFFLASCAGTGERDTLAELHDVKIDIKDQKVEGGIEKAMESYQRFLEETPESAMTPEAIRRLADLKVEKEYDYVKEAAPRTKIGKPGDTDIGKPAQFDAVAAPAPSVQADSRGGKRKGESVSDFEKRAAGKQKIVPPPTRTRVPLPQGEDGLENAGARQAINLYKKLLEKYPNYERNDEVLYNMSRAYEELGDVDQAMVVMNQLVKRYPHSKYSDEVQFRRGEYYFTRKKFLDAEDAYKAITAIGPGSFYYELAMYKLGWAYYKQEMYEDALHQFIALLDYKTSTGFDAEHSKDAFEKKRVEDTYRVISLSFSNLGGSDEITRYFEQQGARPYEVNIYANLGEFYLEKLRFADAAKAYKAFVKRNPFNKKSPHFDMRVIEIYKKGNFGKLVIEASREFASTYGLKSEYWKHFDVKAYPEVLAHLKTNLRELAQYYHALYQNKQFEADKAANYAEAQKWYREFLTSFPKDEQSPGMNYQLAELLLENKAFAEAATEYEHTAYDYPAHDKAAAAGYAAVYARRESLKIATEGSKDAIRRDVVRSSLRFADTFPKHEKAAVVLRAAADDLFEMKDYPQTIVVGHKLLDRFPTADKAVRRGAWLVVAHASFELQKYKEAEEGYTQTLALLPEDDKARADLVDNLAASIYKQGEQASKVKDYKTAAEQFLRVARVAPTSKIRPNAEYDAAAALIQLKEWDRAADVLQRFRKDFPKHELQPEVTKKIALCYKESGKLAVAAAEYERIETETKDEEVRRSALLVAADLYEKVGDKARALQVYRRYVDYFPMPLELALESRYKIAGLYKALDDSGKHTAELKRIVDIDAHAGSERTDRTRYLGAMSLLALTEPLYDQFVAIKLVKPFDKNLKKKRAAMKEATEAFGKLVDYKVGEATGAATYYIAEIYYQFGRALLESERPTNLTPVELEQYELALEDQAAPFEDKAISVHEKNIELLALGAYSAWVDKSIEKLAKLVPARYARTEESGVFIDTLGSLTYKPPVPAPVVAGQVTAGQTGATPDPAPPGPASEQPEATAAGQSPTVAPSAAQPNSTPPSAPPATDPPPTRSVTTEAGSQPAEGHAASSEPLRTESSSTVQPAAPAASTSPDSTAAPQDQPDSSATSR
jgi:TolA-binding protein